MPRLGLLRSASLWGAWLSGQNLHYQTQVLIYTHIISYILITSLLQYNGVILKCNINKLESVCMMCICESRYRSYKHAYGIQVQHVYYRGGHGTWKQTLQSSSDSSRSISHSGDPCKIWRVPKESNIIVRVDVVTQSTTHSVRFLGILSPSIPLPCESMWFDRCNSHLPLPFALTCCCLGQLSEPGPLVSQVFSRLFVMPVANLQWLKDA